MKVITTIVTKDCQEHQFVATRNDSSRDHIEEMVANTLRIANTGFTQGVYFCVSIDDDERGQVLVNGQSLSAFAMNIVD